MQLFVSFNMMTVGVHIYPPDCKNSRLDVAQCVPLRLTGNLKKLNYCTVVRSDLPQIAKI